MKRWWRDYVRAYLDVLAIAERWIPPLHWYAELYRTAGALRRDALC